MYWVILSMFFALASYAEEYTQVGAEKAANNDESIPMFDALPLRAPLDWKPGMHYRNPYADDRVQYIVTHENIHFYRQWLAPGQQALLKAKKQYVLPVYQSRRTARFPEVILEGSQKNLTTVSLTNNGNGLDNFVQGFPFIYLSNDREVAGMQAMWNHLVRYRGGSLKRQVVQAMVDSSGGFLPVRIKQRYARAEYLNANSNPGSMKIRAQDTLFYFLDEVVSPARLSGNILLVHESVDASVEPRRAWIYSKAYKRIKRAPGAAYDTPVPNTYGFRTADSYDMFNGALDKYTWTYQGKQELFVPYNAYDLLSEKVKYDQILVASSVSSEFQRWEKHRVHVVEANLKPGERHIYGRRVMYLDEDSWTILLTEIYDNKGNLWRVSEGHLVNYYDQKLPYYAMEVLYDLREQRYLVFGLNNEEKYPYDFGVDFNKKDFMPSAIRRRSRG